MLIIKHEHININNYKKEVYEWYIDDGGVRHHCRKGTRLIYLTELGRNPLQKGSQHRRKNEISTVT